MAMISYQEALALIGRQAGRPIGRKQKLLNALGKVAAEDILSPIQLPGFRNSAMDGFAVESRLLEAASDSNRVTLNIAGALGAGDKPIGSVHGQAIQIMTGALVPSIYDAVVPVEMVTQDANTVTFHKPAAAGDHIRKEGEDVQLQQRVVEAGQRITPETIMLLSALGFAEVAVAERPVLHIISTGNEVSDDYGVPLTEAQIYNSNAPYLLAAANADGLDACYNGLVGDDPQLFENKLSTLSASSVIISTGAVSKGKWDFIPDSLRKLGATIHFHRVNIRPGKPVLFATLPGGSYFFGLPGNPISAVIGFTFFVKPLLYALQGISPPALLMARLTRDFTKKGDFCQFLKGRVCLDQNGQLQATIEKGQESFKISPLAASNAWVLLEGNQTVWKAGDAVPVQMYNMTEVVQEKGEAHTCRAA